MGGASGCWTLDALILFIISFAEISSWSGAWEWESSFTTVGWSSMVVARARHSGFREQTQYVRSFFLECLWYWNPLLTKICTPF